MFLELRIVKTVNVFCLWLYQLRIVIIENGDVKGLFVRLSFDTLATWRRQIDKKITTCIWYCKVQTDKKVTLNALLL